MRTALAALIVLGSATAAHAGTYVSLGMGGVIDGEGVLAAPVAATPSDTPQQRLALGTRLGRLAIEASLGRFGIGAGDARAVGIHGRLSLPLDGHLNGFLRLGLEHAWLDGVDPRLGDSARGLVGGVGLEYRLEAPILGEAGLWAEVAQDELTFADGSKGGVRTWTVGASLGL